MSHERRLDETRVSAPEVPQHRSRKPTRRWCRGKVGVEHVTVTRLNRMGQRMAGEGSPPCYRWRWGQPRFRLWRCQHEVACTGCGRILRHSLGVDCPTWQTRESRPDVPVDAP